MTFPRYRLHPWHGVTIGPEAPQRVTVYLEIVPTDTVKYELDKASGYLKVDRPQQFSNVCPTLYGLIPQTYCGSTYGAFTAERVRRTGIVGDGDPLDICVLAEKAIPHGDILIQALPIGGLRMLDREQADDKIIAVLADDAVYGTVRELRDVPRPLVERLQHYFLTYKRAPGAAPSVEIIEVYDSEEARRVVEVCARDYSTTFGPAASR